MTTEYGDWGRIGYCAVTGVGTCVEGGRYGPYFELLEKRRLETLNELGRVDLR